jgi:predicted membrane protein
MIRTHHNYSGAFAVKEKTHRQGISGQLVVGLGILAVGIIFLLQTLGIADFDGLMVWIPSLFVLLGIWILISSRFANWSGALLLIIFGGVAQLAALDIISWSDIWKFWPLALVVIGLSIVLDRARGRDGAPTDASNSVKQFAMFSATSTRNTAQEFSGGEITALFGGVELDITEAQVANRPAVLHVFAMFGGAEITVSPDMLVSAHVTPIFGGFEDKRRQRKALPGESAELIVKGTALFGAIEIN